MRTENISPDLVDTLPGRRVIDPTWAQALAEAFTSDGQKQEIEVLQTGERFRLISGGHRLAAAKINASLVRAKVFEAHEYADEAALKLAEISENLKRRELTVLDRAFDVAAWRELYEAAHGTISAGRKKGSGAGQKNRGKLAPISDQDAELDEQSEAFASSFTAASQAALGLSKDAIKRLLRIARISQSVREKISLHPVADNQSELLLLCSQPPQRQKTIASMLTGAPPEAASVSEACDQLDGTPAQLPTERWQKLSDGFTKLTEAQQRRFIMENRAAIEAVLAEIARKKAA